MDGYLKESPRMRQGRKDEKKWLEYYKKHRKKILEIKPTFSSSKQNENYDYLHVQLRLKKLQMEEDRFATIDYENRKLLERIMTVVGDIPITSKRKDFKAPSKGARSLQASRIEKENKWLQDRLDHARAQISTTAKSDDMDLNATSRLKQRQFEEKQIMAQNLKLQERIDHAKPHVSSAPADSEKMNYIREKQRMDEERRVMKENKHLKERIDAARHRLNLTPPKSNWPHASFEDRCKTEASTIEQQNYKLHVRLTEILESDSNFKTDKVVKPRHQRVQRSFSEDNRMMKKRLEAAKCTIVTGKGEEAQKRGHLGENHNAALRHQEEERIREENERMQRRILRIMESHKGDFAKRPGEREHSKQRRFVELHKSIEKENKLLFQRIRNAKPMMSTRNKDQVNTFVPYNDHYQEENKRLRTRLAKIKRGEDPGPRQENEGTSDEDDDEDEELKGGEDENEQNKKPKKEKKKVKKKEYQVPDGYHKKFRKRRKKNQKGEDVEEDDSEFLTETDTD